MPNVPNKCSVNFSATRNDLMLHKPNSKAFLSPLKLRHSPLHHHLNFVMRHDHANND